MAAVFLADQNKTIHGTLKPLLPPLKNKKNIPAETRLSRRFNCKAMLIYEYYDPEDFSSMDMFKMGNANLCNYSRGGMCLAAKWPLRPDLPIFIRLERPAQIPGLGNHHGYHTEVIWCRPLVAGNDNLFRVGVRFYEPIGGALKRL